MGLLKGLSNLLFPPDSLTMSQRLEKIGYFDLVKDSVKLIHIKSEIDKTFTESKWLFLPNDYYISSVYKLKENENKSSTSDFRAFEVWGGDLYEQNVESYLFSAKAVFEKHQLKLQWSDENIDWKKESQTLETINHTIKINNSIYTIYSGNVRDRSRHPAYDYLVNFRMILNQVIQKQNPLYRLIQLTSQESVYFVMVDNKLRLELLEIIKLADNRIDE